LEICMVDEEFLRYGGRQKHIYCLSKELLNRGHNVTIFSPQGSHKWPNVNVEIFKELKLSSGLIEFKFIPTYRFAIRGYDVVHSHDTFFSAFLAKHAKHFFITTHGLRCSLNCSYGFIGKLFHKVITERNLKAANDKGCIFCVSDYDLSLCRKLGFKNSYYIPNGVDINSIQTADGKAFRKKFNINKKVVLEVARLSPVKGQLRFVRDCAEKIQQEADVLFVFAGAKEDEKYIHQLEKEAKKRKINVLILPNPSDEEIFQAYRACDVFILPSEFEGQPISVFEAFAAKKPVVATDVGGIRRSTGKLARLVQFWEPGRFADEVVSLLKDEKLQKSLGRRAFNHVKKFSWDKVAEFVEQKYMKFLH